MFLYDNWKNAILEVGNLLKGLYTATSAMIAQQRRTEMLSNNIANANTSGYKADQGSMRAFLRCCSAE